MTDRTGGAPAGWRPQTRLVRGGTRRSGFNETSEALFMTSGYVYGDAEEAEAAFKGDISRFVYSRYANPTVAMFEERMCLLEGAEEGRATGSGRAAAAARGGGMGWVLVAVSAWPPGARSISQWQMR